MARKPDPPPEPRFTQWCHPDVLARLPDDADRLRHHERCQSLVLGRPCPCPCHTPEEAPVVNLPADLPCAHETVTVTHGEPLSCTTCGAQVPPPSSEPVTPEDAVEVARLAAEQVAVATLGYHPKDWTDAVRLLHALRGPLHVLHAVEANLVTWTYLHGEHGVNMQVEGVPGGVSVVRGRAGESWPGGEDAVKAYVAAQMEDRGGEYPDPGEVVRWVLDVLPTSSPRVTPLRKAGIDPDDYRVSTPGKTSVSTPSRASNG